MTVARDTPIRPDLPDVGERPTLRPSMRINGCRQRVPARTTNRRATVGQVGNFQAGGGDPCPACGQADLRPYGNGSKLACPRCHFILPCCEGGELGGLPTVGQCSGALTDGTEQSASS